MGASNVAELVGQKMRGRGCDLKVKASQGSWTAPTRFEFKINGKYGLLEYWEGSHPDEVMAEMVLIDILAKHWDCTGIQARARLEHERAQAAA